MSIPKSWYDSPVSKLTEYVCEVYNERHPELSKVLQLNSKEFFLAKDFRCLGTEESLAEVIERGGTSRTRNIIFASARRHS